MSKYISTILILMCLTSNLYAEEEPISLDLGLQTGDMLFATPEAVAFHKVNFLPVNLYTGKIPINIPIYEIKIGNIVVPVSLSYNMSGIKVDDEASNVGLGWSLNAGGSVLRIIKNMEDHTSTWAQHWSMYMGEYIFDGRYLTSKGHLINYGDNDQEGRLWTGSSYPVDEDASPDLFLTNAPGLSTKFNIERISKTKYKANILDGTAIIVDTILHGHMNIDDSKVIQATGFNDFDVYSGSNNRNTFRLISQKGVNDYSGFSISNPKGLDYSFYKADLTESIPRHTGNFGVDPFTAYTAMNEYIYQSYALKYSTWHLDKIEDKSTNRKVYFEYIANIDDRTKRKKTHTTHTYIDDKNKLDPFIPYCSCYYSNNDNLNLNYLEKLHISESLYKNTVSNKISKIKWDGGVVEFKYDRWLREDLPSTDYPLTDIIVKNNNGELIKHVRLYYYYFISKEKCNAPECKRLVLKSVEDVTGSIPAAYSFEYYHPHPLAKVGSLEQDYLGYYNNNGAKYIEDETGTERPTIPSIYFSPNKAQYSILPFAPDESYTAINIGHSLESNEYSLSGLLNKISYPTGGTLSLEYENHRFKLFDKEVVGGGARIKKQILNDGDGNKQVFAYKYQNKDGSTSGTINNLPKYGNIDNMHYTEASSYIDPYDGPIEIPESFGVFFYMYNRSRSEVELTDGGFVGYSRVLEVQEGNGYKEYCYTSPNDFTNEREECVTQDQCLELLRKNSLYPALTYYDNDMQRGKVISEITYSNNNNPLVKKEYQYQYDILKENLISFNNVVIRKDESDKRGKDIVYTYNIKSKSERNLLSETTTYEYFEENSVKNQIRYTYDSSFPFVKETLRKTSGREDQINYYHYPNDLISDSKMGETASMLIKENRISSPIQTELSLGGNIIKTSKVLFQKKQGDYPIFIEKVLEQNGTSSEFEKLIMHDYNYYGNPIHITKEDGINIIYLWSYNGQHPIAEIQNATFEDVKSALGWNDNYINTLSAKHVPSDSDIQQINLLRTNSSLKDAHISTYKYKPLIGMIEATDARGVTTYYDYDDFGRLKRTYLKENGVEKTVQSYDYHYRNQ